MVTLLVDVRTLAHNALTGTWRPAGGFPTDDRPETTPADWYRLLGAIDRIDDHLENLRTIAHRALSELEPAVDIADIIEPSTSTTTGAPA